MCLALIPAVAHRLLYRSTSDCLGLAQYQVTLPQICSSKHAISNAFIDSILC